MRNPIILIVIVSLLTSGCATILQPGPDRINVRTEPEGAMVYLDGQQVGRTPMILEVNRKSEGVIDLELEGYEKIHVDKDKIAAGWFFGNLILGGIIGMGVDLACHNQGKYSEDPIYVKLTKNQRADASSHPAR